MILLSHVLFISLHVRAVELVTLIKPIGINENLFRDKNSLRLLKVVGISAILLVLRFSTYSQLKFKESFHIEQLKPELNKQVEHVNLSLHFEIYPLLLTGSFVFLFHSIYIFASFNRLNS